MTDLNAILAQAAGKDDKKSKSKARTITLEDTDLALVDEISELSKQYKATEATLKEKQAILVALVGPKMVQAQFNDGEYKASARVHGAAGNSVLVSWKSQYSTPDWSEDLVKNVKKLVKRCYDSWFTKAVEITVREAWLSDKKLEELLALVGPEKFVDIFSVKMKLKPTENYTEERSLKLSDEAEAELTALGIKQYTASVRAN